MDEPFFISINTNFNVNLYDRAQRYVNLCQSGDLPNDENDIYVEPEDINSFVENIKFYKNSPNEILMHGENGYKYAKLHFDRDKLANEYIEILINHLN